MQATDTSGRAVYWGTVPQAFRSAGALGSRHWHTDCQW